MQIVSITESAKNYLINQCLDNNKQMIKLQVKGGGCAGLSYDFDFVQQDQIMVDDEVVDLNETTKLALDGMSLLYILGTTIDYEQKLGSSKLVLINPNESSSCGCGKSFSVG